MAYDSRRNRESVCSRCSGKGRQASLQGLLCLSELWPGALSGLPAGKTEGSLCLFPGKGGHSMKMKDCFFEKVSHVGLGIALLFVGMGFSVIGGAVLAIIGLLVAAPVYFLAGFYLTAAESPECAIS
jgi:hypothetical protein